jgi:dodecin
MKRAFSRIGACMMVSKVYKIIELIGSSPNGWEEAVKNVIDTASAEITNLRIAEIVDLDTRLEGGKVAEYRAKIRLSFKVEREPETL